MGQAVHRPCEARFLTVEPQPRLLSAKEKSGGCPRDQRQLAHVVLALVEESDLPLGLLQKTVEELGIISDDRRRGLQARAENFANRQHQLRIIKVKLLRLLRSLVDRSSEDPLG